MDTPKPQSVAEKTREALKEGLLVLYRVRQHRAEYSIMNRPEPTVSGVTDHALATAIVHGGKHFPVKRIGKMTERQRIERSDGKSVTYSESIEIDWQTGVIRSTKGQVRTMLVLSIVVEDLMRSAVNEQQKRDNQHGPN